MNSENSQGKVIFAVLLCIFILPGIYFNTAQMFLMVPTMHTRSTGVSGSLAAHPDLLSCKELLVCNEVSPSQHPAVG